MRTDEVTPLAQRLLALKYVTRVETTNVNVDGAPDLASYPDEESSHAESLAADRSADEVLDRNQRGSD